MVGVAVGAVAGDLVDQHAVAVGVGVVLLVEARAGAHVEQVLERAALPRGPAQRGDVLGHLGGGVEHALAGEHADQRRGERLRHRHQQMRVARVHPVDVALEDDAPAVEDADPVRVASAPATPRTSSSAPVEGDRHAARSRGSRGSSSTGPSPREIRAVRASSRTCRNPQRLNGPSSQLSDVTSRSGGGGAPRIRPSSTAVRGRGAVASSPIRCNLRQPAGRMPRSASRSCHSRAPGEAGRARSRTGELGNPHYLRPPRS